MRWSWEHSTPEYYLYMALHFSSFSVFSSSSEVEFLILACLPSKVKAQIGSGILEYGVEISDFWIPRFLWTLSMQKLSTLLLS